MESSREPPDAEPKWQTASRNLRDSLSAKQQFHDLRTLADSFFVTAREEVSACHEALMIINIVSSPNLGSILEERWRCLFRTLNKVAGEELPLACNIITEKNFDKNQALTALELIENNSVSALIHFNWYLNAPKPGRLGTAIGKLSELRSAIGAWPLRSPEDNK
jgi:hypothetical protein